MSVPAEPTPRGALIPATLVASLALVVSLVTSAMVVARAYLQRGEQPFREARTLDVTGSARARITSDLATWTITAVGEGPSLEEAFARLAGAVTGVEEFLGAHGFPPGAVLLGPIDTTTHFRLTEKGYATREVVAFELHRKFHITSADVARVAQAAGQVTELLQSGARVESAAPEFIYTKLADVKVRMIGEATANARQRAETIATQSGCRLGPVKDARAGVLQITRPWSNDVSGGGINDTSSIEKDATSVVHVTFMIER